MLVLWLLALLYGARQSGDKNSSPSAIPVPTVSVALSKLTTAIEIFGSEGGKLILRRRVACAVDANAQKQEQKQDQHQYYELMELQVERRKSNLTLNVGDCEVVRGRLAEPPCGKNLKIPGIFAFINAWYFLARLSTLWCHCFPASAVT